MSATIGQVLGTGGGAVGGFFIGGPMGALWGAQMSMGVGGLIVPLNDPESHEESATEEDGDSPT